MPRPPAAPPPDLGRLDLLRAALRGSATSSDAALAVQFFRARPAGAGFLTADEAQAAVADYDDNRPGWRRALLEEAARVCTQGLPVYAGMAPPLGDLDWSALPMDVHDDRLYRLRPHRFGFLPRLAMASCLGAECLPALQRALASWIRQVETAGLAEDAYFSNLVMIYRQVAIAWAMPFLVAKAEQGDRTAAEVCLQLFRIVAADCCYLLPRLGRSVGNNHLLADRFAAWFLAACYPELVPEAGDLAEAERAWLGEFARQFQADGTNFEQSLHYHELGCELALAYVVITLRRGESPDAEALTRIGCALRFQATLATRNGSGFALGDSTDDPLLPLDTGGAGGWRILYSALFEPAFPETAATAAGAERAYWLLAALRSITLPLRLPRALEPVGNVAAFPLGGYVAFRDDDRDDCLLFRSGPAPGSAVHPGHTMSDLLSVYWTAQGRRVLEPAGTYSYAAVAPPPRGGPDSPRRYFRGPAAHNGPVLRGHDPLGVALGRFRGSEAGARVTTRWRSLEGTAAWAEGRLEETGGLNGWRRGVLRVAGWPTLVYDRPPGLPCDAAVACHWQLASEAVVARRAARQVTADLGGVSAYLCASEGVAAMDCASGSPSPGAGWLSRRYGELEAAPQLICRLQPEARALAFAIGFAEDDNLPEVAAEAVAEGTAVVVRHQGIDIVAVFGGFSGALPPRALDLEFDGDALWLEFSGDHCRRIGALGLRSLACADLDVALSAAEPLRPAAGWRQMAGYADEDGLCGLWEPLGQGQRPT